MRDLPSFQTSLVPMGNYTAEVTGEISEKVSNFDNARTYLNLHLDLQSSRGEHFSYVWSFTPRSPKLADFLLAIGGKRLPSGNVQPPRGPYMGKKVILQIGQRTAKGSQDGRLVNEVLAIYPYDEPTAPPTAGGDDISVPF